MSEITQLLNEQFDLLTEIRDLTLAEDFSEVMDAEKAERYIILYEEREPLMALLGEIESEVLALCGGDKSVILGEDGLLAAKIGQMAKEIYETDGNYQKSAGVYNASLQGEIRGLKKGRAANEAYINEIYSDGGTMMNRKN